MYPKIPIIIPVYQASEVFYEYIKKCLLLDYPDYEILVVTDTPLRLTFKNPKIRVILTNQEHTGPAEKRDLAIEQTKGEYIAFLDDDSYPEKDWLKKANCKR